jgi:hypothetical protein
MSDGGRFGGELDPPWAAQVLRRVADPDNWHGLTPSQKTDLQNAINDGLTKEQKRLVSAVLKKGRK